MPPDRTCRARGCRNDITKVVLDQLGGKARERTLCSKCFESLREQGSITLQTGKSITHTNPRMDKTSPYYNAPHNNFGRDKSRQNIQKANLSMIAQLQKAHMSKKVDPLSNITKPPSAPEATEADHDPSSPIDDIHQDFETGIESSFQHTTMLSINTTQDEGFFDATSSIRHPQKRTTERAFSTRTNTSREAPPEPSPYDTTELSTT